MIRKLHIIFLFYRGYLLPSAIFNVVLLVFGISLPVAIFFKMALITGVILRILTGSKGNQLTFYRNFSISSFLLFGSCIILDLLLLIASYLIVAYVN